MKQITLPGMEEEEKEEKVSFHVGKPKNSDNYFDAASLPDAPGKQDAAIQAYTLYVVFPSWETLQEGIAILSGGERKGLPRNAKFATINSMGIIKKIRKTFFEFWKEQLSNGI